MSGFDFDALRDPDAPQPGARERMGVDARAHQLRARSRRNRLVMTATSIVAIAAVVVGVISTRTNPGPSVTVTSPSSTSASSIADRFVPATSVSGGTTTVPVTLPDGETFTMQYPQKLQIAQLGFSGSINVRWPVAQGRSACCGRSVGISYTDAASVFGRATPVGTYRGADGGTVQYLHAPQDPVGGPYISEEDLVFQFGPWLVRVPANSLTDQQRATWARSLTGSVDSNGYLLLDAQAPLSIGNQFDGGFGIIDEANFVRLTSHSDNRQGQIACGPGQSDSRTHRRRALAANGWAGYSWCIDNDFHVAVGGASSFVATANKQLEVSPLTSPTTTATTPSSTSISTTTTAEPVSVVSASAESASFVSPQQGWLLEPSGEVLGTTDGGAAWRAVGHVGLTSDTAVHIRFADASHGFVFTTEPTGKAPLLTTTDGGVHWSSLATPFSAVSDLAISNGVVYVAGVPKTSSQSFPGFRIWSKSAAGTRWSMDPLVIPVGAGPIPFQYLVFSGGNGWMVNNDRDFISGARLSATAGRWSKWTPPCTGGAQLAASTSRDLVLACGPPFATSASATTIAFSHDGGNTFGPPSVPGTGFVQSGPFSPSANTAFVAASGGLQRTTDGGASWHLVLPADVSQGFADYGFTTSTQGFVIFGGSGEMLMTYDAGATWQKVMGP